MRVLVVGDAHMDTDYLLNAVDLAVDEGCSYVHVIGDFGFFPNIPEGRKFLDTVNKYADARGVTITFTDGNHEDFDALYRVPVSDDGWRRVRSHIWYAPRGHIWKLGDTVFMSVGGASSIGGPDGPNWHLQGSGIAERGRGKRFDTPQPEKVPNGFDLGDWWCQEVLTDEEVEYAITQACLYKEKHGRGVDVVLSHDCPIRMKLKIREYQAGQSNRARLQQIVDAVCPKLLIHGHYHHWTHGRIKNGPEVVGLSRHVSQYGQYVFLETNPLELLIPRRRTYRRL